MTQEERREWMNLLEIRRDAEIQQMFSNYTDSYCANKSDFIGFSVFGYDREMWILAEMLGKKKDRERKQHEKKRTIH